MATSEVTALIRMKDHLATSASYFEGLPLDDGRSGLADDRQAWTKVLHVPFRLTL